MLHFYSGGTEGARDGTLISSGDLTAPAIFDGMYPASGSPITVTRDVYLRADTGETYKNVMLGVQQNVPKVRIWVSSVSPTSCYRQITNKAVTSSGSTRVFNIYTINTLQDTNVKITLTIVAKSDDTNTPDTTAKLVAYPLEVNDVAS